MRVSIYSRPIRVGMQIDASQLEIAKSEAARFRRRNFTSWIDPDDVLGEANLILVRNAELRGVELRMRIRGRLIEWVKRERMRRIDTEPIGPLTEVARVRHPAPPPVVLDSTLPTVGLSQRHEEIVTLSGFCGFTDGEVARRFEVTRARVQRITSDHRKALAREITNTTRKENPHAPRN